MRPVQISAFADPLVFQGQTFTVIGAAGELPKPPEKPIVFLEGEIASCRAYTSHHTMYALDMDESQMAEAVTRPLVSLTPTDLLVA